MKNKKYIALINSMARKISFYGDEKYTDKKEKTENGVHYVYGNELFFRDWNTAFTGFEKEYLKDYETKEYVPGNLVLDDRGFAVLCSLYLLHSFGNDYCYFSWEEHNNENKSHTFSENTYNRLFHYICDELKAWGCEEFYKDFDKKACERIWNLLEEKDWYGCSELKKSFHLLYLCNKYRNNPDGFSESMSNLFVNHFYIENQKKVYNRNAWLVGETEKYKEHISKKDLLKQDFDEEELLCLIKMYNEYFDHTLKDTNTAFKIFNNDDFVKAVKVFLGKDDSIRLQSSHKERIDEYDRLMNGVWKTLNEKMEDKPGFCALLSFFTQRSSSENLSALFIPKPASAYVTDGECLIELEQELKAKKGEETSWWEQAKYSAIINDSVRNDLGTEPAAESDRRCRILQNLYFFLLWDISSIEELRSGVSEFGDKAFGKGKESYTEDFDKISTEFLKACSARKGKNYWKNPDFIWKMLDTYSILCGFVEETPFMKNFKSLSFDTFNRSCCFDSNKALVISYHTMASFKDEGEQVLINQLDFIDSQQTKLLDTEEDTNRLSLRKIDSGFSRYINQNIRYDDGFFRKMTFKIWKESDRKLKSEVKKVFSAATRDQISELQNRNLNSGNLNNHYFYDSERCIAVHHCTYRSVEKILEKPERFLNAQKDAKDYIEELLKENSEDKLALFFKKKYLIIWKTIYKKIKSSTNEDKDSFNQIDSLYDDKNNLNSDFDLKEYFGRDFYDECRHFFEQLYLSDTDMLGQCSLELSVYSLYIALRFAQIDAEKVKEEHIEDYVGFNVSEENLKTWESVEKFNNIEYSNRNVLAYSLFDFYIRDWLKSEHLEDWKLVPAKYMAKIYNGDTENLPAYIKDMKGVMEDAKKLHEAFNNKIRPSKNIAESLLSPVTRTYRDDDGEERSFIDNSFSGFRHKLDELEEKPRLYFKDDNVYGKVQEINGFKQKIYSRKSPYGEFESLISVFYNEKTERFEVYLGKKLSENQVPVFTTPGLREHMDRGIINKFIVEWKQRVMSGSINSHEFITENLDVKLTEEQIEENRKWEEIYEVNKKADELVLKIGTQPDNEGDDNKCSLISYDSDNPDVKQLFELHRILADECYKISISQLKAKNNSEISAIKSVIEYNFNFKRKEKDREPIFFAAEEKEGVIVLSTGYEPKNISLTLVPKDGIEYSVYLGKNADNPKKHLFDIDCSEDLYGCMSFIVHYLYELAISVRKKYRK